MEAKQGEELMRLSDEHQRVAAHLNDLQGALLDAKLHETHRYNQVCALQVWESYALRRAELLWLCVVSCCPSRVSS